MNELHTLLARSGRRPWRLTLALVALALGCLTVVVAASAAGSPPVNTAPPTLSGTPQQGHVMTVQSGSWSGDTPIVFSYQWKRCDSGGCTDIGGAASQTYTVAAADVGKTLRVLVTASNDGGSGTGTALSAASATISAENAPVNTSAPSISGSAVQGATLTASNGGWSGTSITFTYQWFRCDSHGDGCAAIGGANAQSYVSSSADVGHTVKVEVTATNSSGSGTATSGSSSMIVTSGGLPANTQVPTLSGATNEGATLTLSQGTWQGTGLAFGFGWQRCDANGDSCSTIAGATGTKYTLARADVGNRIRGAVIASNESGSTTAYTPLSAIVGSLLEPVNTSLPTITGAAAVGHVLSAGTGAWSGSTPFQFYYQWARSNSKGGFDPIAQATSTTYKLTSADLGHQLFVQIKAQNKYGPAWADSKPTSTVTATAAAPGVVSVASVALPDRLVISGVSFNPQVLRTRNAFQLRVVVKDSAGHPVQGALVYEIALPYGIVHKVPEQQTGADGSATLTITPTAKLPVGHRGSVVLFLRARKPGGSVLAGVSTRRLVQVLVR
jgi:large repetitive protein